MELQQDNTNVKHKTKIQRVIFNSKRLPYILPTLNVTNNGNYITENRKDVYNYNDPRFISAISQDDQFLEPQSWLFDIITLGRGMSIFGKSRKRFPIAERSSKISSQELSGIPKGERNQKIVYRHLGNGKFPRSREETFKVENPRFGNLIGEGSEQTVFVDNLNPDRVLKVYSDRGFKSIEDIKKFHTNWFKRNKVPFQEKLKFEGYIQDVDNLFPVYSQNRVNPIGDIPYSKWEKDIMPIIKDKLKARGFDESYYNGKIHLNDISPFNVGYDSKGNLRFFDVDAYKKGGTIC